MKLFSFLQHPSLVLLINVLILFPLRLGLSNMFFVKTFRARQRQLVSIRLSNVDMMCEPRFWELCLDQAMPYCLPYTKKTLISQVKRRIPGMRLFIVILQTQCQLIQIPPSHPGYWSNLQTRFLIWNHYTVNCTLIKDKKYSE